MRMSVSSIWPSGGLPYVKLAKGALAEFERTLIGERQRERESPYLSSAACAVAAYTSTKLTR